jgi:hypothetical protein
VERNRNEYGRKEETSSRFEKDKGEEEGSYFHPKITK